MRLTLILLMVLALLAPLVLTGCGGEAASDGSDHPASGGGSSTSTTPTANAAGRIGPEEMPNRDVEPLQFLYWRVDQMYDNADVDGDGHISPDEYNGEPYNFERIDANGDGLLSKQEIVDDMVPVLREEGKIP